MRVAEQAREIGLERRFRVPPHADLGGLAPTLALDQDAQAQPLGVIRDQRMALGDGDQQRLRPRHVALRGERARRAQRGARAVQQASKAASAAAAGSPASAALAPASRLASASPSAAECARRRGPITTGSGRCVRDGGEDGSPIARPSVLERPGVSTRVVAAAPLR